MSEKLTMASIGDVHLGHRQTPTELIIDNLNATAINDEIFSQLDILWLVGDMFDMDLQMSAPYISAIQLFAIRLLRLAKKHDVVVRVLEGTPSHDRKQSEIFHTLNIGYDIHADLKYVDTLSIEYIERFNIHVLYVPDEYHATTDQTWEEVQGLLQHHGIDKVDYAIMHGMFEHQAPVQMVAHLCHKAQNYIAIVRKYIFIGHIHTKSVFENILAAGSFDRLCQGEEEDKGYWKVESHADSFDSDKLTFMVNKGAKIYKTITITGLEEEDARKALEVVEQYPYLSNIRVVTNKSETNLAIIGAYRRNYPQYRWDVSYELTDKVGDISVKPKLYNPTPINRNTIVDIIKARLIQQGVDERRMNGVIELLSAIK